MSIRAMAAVWDEPLEPTTKLLLLALADYADQSGTCWPSYPTLARRVGVSERQVARLVAAAESAGYLTRLRGGKGPRNSTRYTLTIGRVTPATLSRVTPATLSKGDTGGAKGDTGDSGRVSPVSVEPLGNRHLEPGNKNDGRIEVTDALHRARAAIDPRIFGNGR